MDPSAPPLPDGDDGVRTPVKDNTYGFECTDLDGNVTHPMEIIPVYDPGDPFAPLAGLVAPRNLMNWVYAQTDTVGTPPTLVTSPPAGARQITGIKTWFWISDSWNRDPVPRSEGGFTAVVAVSPNQLRVDPGDGTGTVTCDEDEAIAWGSGPKDTKCGHTYHRRSTDPKAPGHRSPGVYNVSATLSYTARWEVWEGAPGTGILLDGGDLGTVTSAPTVVPLTVHSVEAVIR